MIDRRGVLRGIVFVSALLGVEVRVAGGAFEMLPGPLPGSAADWAYRPFEDSEERRGIRVEAICGSPAAADGLLWMRGRLALSSSVVAADLEWDQLRLEGIYGETAIACLLEIRGLGIGLRRWERRSSSLLDASGWTLTGLLRLRHGGWRLALGRSDARISGPARGGPIERRGLRVARRLAPGLESALGAAISVDGAIVDFAVRWSILDEIALDQRIRFPGSGLTSGLILRVARVGVSLWYEPNPALGSRVGVACAFP